MRRPSHDVARALELSRELVAVEGTRSIDKRSMIHNDALPKVEVDPETYEARADGELLTCQPATVLPMAQRYFPLLSTERLVRAVEQLRDRMERDARAMRGERPFVFTNLRAGEGTDAVASFIQSAGGLGQDPD